MILYILFALLATAANILSQDLAIRLYAGMYSVFLSVMIGTGVGLLLKYWLDKRYIFRFRTRDAVHDGQTFFLYALTGILTTTVFWGFEFGFDYFFKTKELRYLGGAIGLALGYIAKYQLDKRLVFHEGVAR